MYEDLRPLLFSIAYGMLGSASEAEDAVQEAMLRAYRAETGGVRIERPRAYLGAAITRLCIDWLGAARARREVYVGTWLPEPLVRGRGDDAAGRAEAAEGLSVALLAVMERLSPVERAVFLLHDVLEYEFAEIAALLDRRAENCRQIAVRARRKVRGGPARHAVEPARRDELARRFLAAFEEGDTDGLARMLAQDATFYGDGGGRAPAVPAPLAGAHQVLRILLGLAAQAARLGIRPRPAVVNGEPGFVTEDAAGRVVGVVSLDVDGERVRGVYSIVNPDKLRHLGPVRELGDLLRG